MAGNGKTSRRQERIFAFKVLYGLSFHKAETREQLENMFLRSPDRPEFTESAAGFAWDIVRGVWEKQKEIDAAISSFSQNWRVERMGKVELTLLRIALLELLYCHEVPPKVALNEAIELSKQFGDDKSRGFVNGVLDAAAHALEAGTLRRSGPALS